MPVSRWSACSADTIFGVPLSDAAPASVSTEDAPGGLPPGARAFFDWVVVVGVALLVAVLVRTFLLARPGRCHVDLMGLCHDNLQAWPGRSHAGLV